MEFHSNKKHKLCHNHFVYLKADFFLVFVVEMEAEAMPKQIGPQILFLHRLLIPLAWN